MRRLSAVISLFVEVEGAAAAALEKKLARAVVVPPAKISGSVVTMNSRVVCRDERGVTREIEVVYPWHEDARSGKTSVLHALGRALLGAAVGDAVDVTEGAARGPLVVEAICYQPEAAGEYHL
jgi:regulator of nucleoside diphosphate kinase